MSRGSPTLTDTSRAIRCFLSKRVPVAAGREDLLLQLRRSCRGVVSTRLRNRLSNATLLQEPQDTAISMILEPVWRVGLVLALSEDRRCSVRVTPAQARKIR